METVDLSVDGMTCGSCVQAAKRALSRIPGVESVDVRLEEGAATVRGQGIAAQALVAALAEVGYPARLASAAAQEGRRNAPGGCGSGRASGGCCCGH